MKIEEKKVSEKDIYSLGEKKKKTPEEEAKERKKKKITYICYLLFILVVTGVVLAVSLTQGNTAEQVFKLFKNMNFKYFYLLCGTIIFAFALNSFILWLFVKLYSKHYPYHRALANKAIGTFYDGITPGSSGGQVAQIYTFKKQGISVSNAASVMVMMYIVYQSCLILMGIISVTTHAKDFLDLQTINIVINGQQIPIPIVLFIILGFGLNLLVIALLVFMSTSSRFQSFITGKVINFGAKLHLIKKPDETRLNVNTQVENFRIEFRRLQSNIPFTLLVSFLTFLALAIVDSYPFICGLALNGFKEFSSANEVIHNLFLSIVYTNFHQMITGLIPIPGSSGISEYVFYLLFNNYFNAENFESSGGTNAVMLLWRFMTFHIPFLITGIISATYRTSGPHKDEFISADRKTYYTIQMETFDERKASSDRAYQTNVVEKQEKFVNLIKKKKNKFEEIEDEDIEKKDQK
jgi:glycosyltransferase 2 family protein